MERYRCEFCARLLSMYSEPYLVNDQGVVRAFCGQTHSNRYMLQKYAVPMPLDFGDGAPFFGYLTPNSPFTKRGVTNDGRMQDDGEKAGKS